LLVGEMMIDYLLAMDPGDAKKQMEGVPTTEPAFNLPAVWIPENKKEEAQFAGYSVVDLSTVIATHLTEVIKSHAGELLGRQEVQRLLDNLAKTSPKTVEELNSALPWAKSRRCCRTFQRAGQHPRHSDHCRDPGRLRAHDQGARDAH
jgi:flagellar biosynthesis protein FlhA